MPKWSVLVVNVVFYNYSCPKLVTESVNLFWRKWLGFGWAEYSEYLIKFLYTAFYSEYTCKKGTISRRLYSVYSVYSRQQLVLNHESSQNEVFVITALLYSDM